MKTKILKLTALLLILVTSCEKVGNIDGEHIKSILIDNKIVHNYYYDSIGNIIEESSQYYYAKYLYNENYKLVKVETAFNNDIYSSAFVEGNEFMTSENSTINRYRLFEYDSKGRLSKIENYFSETAKNFEYRSMQTFEYNGAYVVKENLHNTTGEITHFRVYSYDSRGNIANEKHFSRFNSEPELVRETSYKYDNYKNPFRVFCTLGQPGIYTNKNNIIETNSTLYQDVSGIDKNTNSKTTYQYNENGFPVKAIFSNNVEEYRY